MLNTSPREGAVCRAMKVGKEEVIGFLTASETWVKNDLNALNREWNARIQPISTLVKPCRSRPTLLFQRPGTGTETLHISWDQEKRGIGVTVKQSWNLSPSTIQPSEVLIVGQRLRELLRTAQKAAPAAQRFVPRQHSRAKEDALHASTLLRNCFAGCEHRLCSTEPGRGQVLVGGGCGWLCLSGGTKWQSPRWRRCRKVLRTGGPGF
jgi:hypothetical protein